MVFVFRLSRGVIGHAVAIPLLRSACSWIRSLETTPRCYLPNCCCKKRRYLHLVLSDFDLKLQLAVPLWYQETPFVSVIKGHRASAEGSERMKCSWLWSDDTGTGLHAIQRVCVCVRACVCVCVRACVCVWAFHAFVNLIVTDSFPCRLVRSMCVSVVQCLAVMCSQSVPVMWRAVWAIHFETQILHYSDSRP